MDDYGRRMHDFERRYAKKYNNRVYEDDIIAIDENMNIDEKTLEKYKKSIEKQKKVIDKQRSNIIQDNFARANNDYMRENSHFVRVTGGTIGRVVDLGIDDEGNMGGAMAPAACDTILTHFKDTGRDPDYYDGIFTGDLGRFGKETLKYLLKRKEYNCRRITWTAAQAFSSPNKRPFRADRAQGAST